MKKMFVLITMMVAALFLITGCSTSNKNMLTDDVNDSQAVIDALNNAKEIKLKKDFISFGDSWKVTADGTEVAEIKGQAFYLIGDTYSMYSKNGNFVGAEGEQYRVINARADMYDMNGNSAGSIKQELNILLYKFTLKNIEGNKIGEMNQNFSIKLSGDIKNVQNETAWSFKKDLISVGASIKLTRGADSDISAMTAIWMTVIANEISEASSQNNVNDNSRTR